MIEITNSVAKLDEYLRHIWMCITFLSIQTHFKSLSLANTICKSIFNEPVSLQWTYPFIDVAFAIKFFCNLSHHNQLLNSIKGTLTDFTHCSRVSIVDLESDNPSKDQTYDVSVINEDTKFETFIWNFFSFILNGVVRYLLFFLVFWFSRCFLLYLICVLGVFSQRFTPPS